MSFASLKKASSKGDTLAKLTREIEKINQPQASSGPDDQCVYLSRVGEAAS